MIPANGIGITHMSQSEKPAPATGLSRIWRAFFYSIDGFKLAFRDEAAFRQELLLVGILSIVCFVLPLEPWVRVAIMVSHGLVLITELLNTAVESVVDRASPEFHQDAKKAKDTASSAVLLSLIVSGGVWIYAITTLF